MNASDRKLSKAKADETWASKLDQVIDHAIDERHIVGAAVIAARNGNIIYRREAGLGDRESFRSVQPNELFRLASMSKAIVSTAALAMMDKNQIRLDDPVTRWLPLFRPKLVDGREPVITARHLLTHTAGLN